MHHLIKSAILGVTILVSSTAPSQATDLFPSAATEFRYKNYNESVRIALKAAETPQRDFLLAVAALRMGKYEEALPQLSEAEKKLPMLSDYAALYQAEAFLKLKKFQDAAVRAASLPKLYPSSLLIRRAEKINLDALFEAGDFTGAFKAAKAFIEKYPSGSDSVEALYLSAISLENSDDKIGASRIYRNIWLNNPTSPQAKKAEVRLRELEKQDVVTAPYTVDELLRRSSTLYQLNDAAASLQTLRLIPAQSLTGDIGARVALRSGIALYRLRKYKEAEQNFARAVAGAAVAAVKSEARFWLAKSLERQNLDESAHKIYMELAAEGKKQEYADDALIEAAGMVKNQGNFSGAALLFEQFLGRFPDSRFVPRAAWEGAWSRYLAGEHAVAAEAFKALLKDETIREKVLYWLARSLEKTGNSEAVTYYQLLQADYPAGFYATWHREQKGLRDTRETLKDRNAEAELPSIPGFEKPRLLASLGMVEEARNEIAAVAKKMIDQKAFFPALAKVYLEAGDYNSAIWQFQKNRPHKWEKKMLPIWTAGFPLAHTAAVSRYAAENGLSESLVYSIIRNESGFSTAIKSPAGAIGLMQLMPATAKQTANEKGEFDPLRLTNADFNIKLGTRHFKDLLKDYDSDLIYSIAAYNAGANAVNRWKKNLKGLQKDEFIESIPYQETREYVKKVYASIGNYRQLYGLK